MKKLLSIAAFILLMMPAMGQMWVTLTGNVTDSATGNPLPNYPVTIFSDSTSGFFYYNTVYTTQGGHFADSIWVTTSSGLLNVQVWDCNQTLHQDTCNFSPGNTFFVNNFSICYNNTPNCNAEFTWNASIPLTVYFTDLSTNPGGIWYWWFGDGTTSNLQHPVHTYASPGTYSAELMIGDSIICSDYAVHLVVVQDSTGGGSCTADFYAVQDSNANMTYSFFNQSSGNITSWFWNFGDGYTSNIENPTHTYAQSGWYNVCLTIQGPDSLCYDTQCDSLIVAGGGGCQADYSFIPDSIDPMMIRFFDNSTGNILYWTWNFGDPASGVNNTSNLQNSTHIFSAPGYYTVCLSIQGADSLCYDTYCETILVGNNAGCQAQFTYYPDSTPAQGYLIQFLDLSSGSPVSWSWNFGDSTPVVIDQNPLHIYPVPGTYYVCLTIQCQGVTSTWCMNVEVGPVINCTNYFTYSGVDLTMSYAGYMLYGQPADFYWNFGDGQTATGTNATHTYAAAGIYYVTLSTVDTTGCQYSSGQSVMVGDSGEFYQVYGQVFAGNFPATPGLVMIMGIDTTLNYFPFIDIAYLDSIGVYYFPMVPTGNYYIYAIPFDSGLYLPTYYGDALFWPEATVVTLPQPANPYNINLIPAGLLIPGPGIINGQVNTGDFFAGMVDKITMILMDENSNVLSFAKVDDEGAFGFPQLGYGTYYLHAEMAGCTSDLITVEITEQNPDVNVVLTFSGGHILGVNNHTLTLDAGVIYPNPVREEANINVNTANQTVLTVEVIDLTGRSVRKVIEHVSAGNHRITIPVGGLPSGLYTLRIYSGEGLTAAKKLVISR